MSIEVSNRGYWYTVQMCWFCVLVLVHGFMEITHHQIVNRSGDVGIRWQYRWQYTSQRDGLSFSGMAVFGLLFFLFVEMCMLSFLFSVCYLFCYNLDNTTLINSSAKQKRFLFPLNHHVIEGFEFRVSSELPYNRGFYVSEWTYMWVFRAFYIVYIESSSPPIQCRRRN
jgi:hypothetical protein